MWTWPKLWFQLRLLINLLATLVCREIYLKPLNLCNKLRRTITEAHSTKVKRIRRYLLEGTLSYSYKTINRSKLLL